MHFTNVRYDGESVQLKWEDTSNDGEDKHDWKHDDPPTPAFKAALAALAPWVVWLIRAPEKWSENLEIRQLSLKDEDGVRGVVITALRRIDRAKNRTVTINTPFMSAPPADYNGPLDGYLTSETLALIDEIEVQAAKYKLGERGEQTAMELDDKSAPVDPPKKRDKKNTQVLGVGTVVNPDETGTPDDENLRKLILAAGFDVPIDAIQKWNSNQRDQSLRWGNAMARVRGGDLRLEAAPKRPKIIDLDATPALGDEIVQ